MSALPAPLILTDDQFEDMARRGAFVKVGRVELRRGMLAAMSPVYMPHAGAVSELTQALLRAVGAAGLNLKVWNELSIRFGGGFQPTADIVVFDPAAVQDESGPLPGAAARLVVEVADASLADDLGPKLEDYAAAGLAEYWVADVQGGVLLRHAEPQAVGGYRVRAPAAMSGEVGALTLPVTLTL